MVVSGITGSEQVLAPSMSTVLELVRRGVMNQYPGLMPTLYPGEVATVPTTFGSTDAMWSAFQVLATNKTPAISGEEYFSLPPLAGLSSQSHAGSRSQTKSAAPSSHAGHVGSSRNPVVMSVAHADHDDSDPFSRSHSYQHWPAEPSHWDTVFQVSGSFNTDDPPLWSTA